MAAKRRGLAQRRKAVGLNQEALAGELDVDRSTVVRWEGGASDPLPWTRPKLAQALHLSVDQLGELLVEELGNEPGPEIQQLHQQIIDADPVSARSA